MNKSNFKLNKEGRVSTFFIIIIAFIIAFLIFSAVFYVNVLMAKDFFSGDVLLVRKVNPDSYIGIIYTHSVQKTETSEWYKVEDGKLILMEQRYKSQGAGLPTQPDYKFRHTKDGFALYDMNVPFEDVIYRTGAVIANHRLNVDGKEKPFLEFSKKKEAVEFNLEEIPLIKFIILRCING